MDKSVGRIFRRLPAISQPHSILPATASGAFSAVMAKPRSWGRVLYDSFYCRSFPDKKTLGEGS
jgi:hypothetical protein